MTLNLENLEMAGARETNIAITRVQIFKVKGGYLAELSANEWGQTLAMPTSA